MFTEGDKRGHAKGENKMEKRDGIKIESLKGTWYVIDETEWNYEKVYLLEHETYGDEVACIIVNENLKIIAVDVWNGFGDLPDIEDYIEVPIYSDCKDDDGFYNIIGYRKEYI